MSDENEKYAEACRKLLYVVLEHGIKDKGLLNRDKLAICREMALQTVPRNSDIIMAAPPETRDYVKNLLRRKPVRTISGVAVIAAMTSPAPCPHGICVPCPGGPSSVFRSPQSYMGKEPAAMRAINYDYDPYRIVGGRLSQLEQIGHDVDKAELIIMGGTFPSRSLDYQEWFVRRCLEAMNDFRGKEWRNNVFSRGQFVLLEQVQKANENAMVRNTGMTFETRPDWANEAEVDRMLRLGATKVELGVQNVFDFVLSRMNRGHSVADTVHANRILRDSGLKVGFHMMPGLPGSSRKRDLQGFKRLFTDPKFMPDYLKIYPTLVTEGTELCNMWENGQYSPLDDDEAIDLIADIKAILPKWVRLQRIQRDIPSNQILAGVRMSNIRQLASDRLEERGSRCRCIRCREAGHNMLKGREPSLSDIELQVESYVSCGGLEHFISFEDVNQDILIGFLRLRYPHNPHRQELRHSALVRELHVYGSLVPPGKEAKAGEWQHRGYGAELLKTAEEMAKAAGYRELSIVSGIGVREYYRKFGYHLNGVYMSRLL